MGCMLIVAFFAATGLTLHHPTWSLGSTKTTTETGVLPAAAIDAGGTVDYLAISEYVRDTYGVSGKVKNYGTVNGAGHIDYAGPGYSASATFSATDSSLVVTITQGDLLAVMNDIHKGRDTSGSWGWVIDASAILLLVVAATGIAIQVFQRKRRRSAMVTLAVWSLLTVIVLYAVAR
jgi:hypothetical protein